MMSYIRSRKFCCCIPVRYGTIVIAILGLIGGGFIAVQGLIQISQTSHNKFPLLAQAIIYGFLAVISALGLIGAFARLRRLVSSYRTMLMAHLVFSIASGAYSLWYMFHNKEHALKDCMGQSGNHLTKTVCKNTASFMRIVMVAVFLFVWVTEIWGCVIVNEYSKELRAAGMKLKEPKATWIKRKDAEVGH